MVKSKSTVTSSSAQNHAHCCKMYGTAQTAHRALIPIHICSATHRTRGEGDGKGREEGERERKEGGKERERGREIREI